MGLPEDQLRDIALSALDYMKGNRITKELNDKLYWVKQYCNSRTGKNRTEKLGDIEVYYNREANRLIISRKGYSRSFNSGGVWM